MSSVPLPQRGEVWLADLEPTFGHEQGGSRKPSAILCDAIRSIDRRRLIDLWGSVNATTLAIAEDRLRRLLSL